MKLTLLSIFLLFTSVSIGQGSDMVVITTENDNKLIAGIHNYISIIAMQDTPVAVDQISAHYISHDGWDFVQDSIELKIEKSYGRYFIHPKRVGLVEFQIEVHGKVETIRVSAKPLEAICRLGRFGAKLKSKIPAGVFKAMPGIIPWVECCGFDAKCKMVGFETIRVPLGDVSSRSNNIGGRFEESTQVLIDQAKPGDMFIFRNLYYRCPGSEGDKQRSEDMIFEIE